MEEEWSSGYQGSVTDESGPKPVQTNIWVDLSEIEQQNKSYGYGRNNMVLPNLWHDIQQVKTKLRNRSDLKIESLGPSFWAHPEHGPPSYCSSLLPFQERTQRKRWFYMLLPSQYDEYLVSSKSATLRMIQVSSIDIIH